MGDEISGPRFEGRGLSKGKDSKRHNRAEGEERRVLGARCATHKNGPGAHIWELSGRQAHLDRYLCFRAKSHEVIERKQFHLAASDFGEPGLRDTQLSSRLRLRQFVLLHPTPQGFGQLRPQQHHRRFVRREPEVNENIAAGLSDFFHYVLLV